MMVVKFSWTFRVLVVSTLAVLAAPVAAQDLDLAEPGIYEVKSTWSADLVGVPGPFGGLLFSESGESLYVVGEAELPNSALYAVPVARDPATNEVVELGPIDKVRRLFNGSIPGLDSGLEYGPESTLFYTYYARSDQAANKLAQRPDGGTGPERVFDMLRVGIPQSVTGLTFSPHIIDLKTKFGLLQVSAWSEAQDAPAKSLYNVPLISDNGGFFEPQEAEVFVTLPVQNGTGAIRYIPSGSSAGNLMYVNWETGRIDVLLIDQATGFPIDDRTGLAALGTRTPRLRPFASGLGRGPWGLAFDPMTNDLFVSTFQRPPSNSVIQIGGFPKPDVVHFVRGDANASSDINLTDAVVTLNHLFLGGPAPDCLDAADADDNGDLEITDAVYTLNFLFLGGTAIPEPAGVECGVDPTADDLGCDDFARCP